MSPSLSLSFFLSLPAFWFLFSLTPTTSQRENNQDWQFHEYEKKELKKKQEILIPHCSYNAEEAY